MGRRVKGTPAASIDKTSCASHAHPIRVLAEAVAPIRMRYSTTKPKMKLIDEKKEVTNYFYRPSLRFERADHRWVGILGRAKREKNDDEWDIHRLVVSSGRFYLFPNTFYDSRGLN